MGQQNPIQQSGMGRLTWNSPVRAAVEKLNFREQRSEEGASGRKTQLPKNSAVRKGASGPRI